MRANPTDAEIALDASLRRLGIAFKVQAVIHDRKTGAHCIVDALCHLHFKVFEADGGGHKRQKGYDAGRDRWLVRRWGLRVERHWNNWSDPGIDGRVMSVLVRKASP
jgi:very-short-patch-repair endonuclease